MSIEEVWVGWGLLVLLALVVTLVADWTLWRRYKIQAQALDAAKAKVAAQGEELRRRTEPDFVVPESNGLFQQRPVTWYQD